MVFLRRMSHLPRKKKGSFIPLPYDVAVAKSLERYYHSCQR
jgi:hypothetical protein